MNDLANIASLPRTGIPTPPPAPAESRRGQRDAFDLSPTPPQEGGIDSDPETPALPASPKSPTAEITALLQKNGKPADAPQTLSPDDLTAEITAALQKTGAVFSDNKIRPALISDLVGNFSLQLQDQPPLANNDLYQSITGLQTKDAAAPPELTELLDKIQAGNGGESDIEKVIAQIQSHLQAQNQDHAQNIVAAPDPAILQLLKDAATQLQSSGDGNGNSALAKLKTELAATLKDQGVGQPAIEFYLAALSKFVKQGDVPSAKPADQPDAAAVVGQTFLQQAALNAAPAENASSRQADPPQMPPLPDAVKSADPVDGSIEETSKLDAPQRTADPPLPQKDESAARLQPAAGAPPAPLQNAGVKIDPAHINAHMINMLANGDSGLGADDFGAGNGDPSQNPPDGIGLLKPATADALNAQNFTNYLTAARNLPGAVTQMIAIHLQRNINAKISTMTLQLEPADLGRLDIKLKFDKEGGVRAHLSVEKPETLAMLQRDSHHLEKVLQQTGLDFDENALSFDLRQQNQRQNLEGFGDKGNADEFSSHINGTEKTLQAKIAVQANGYITQNGVNIIV